MTGEEVQEPWLSLPEQIADRTGFVKAAHARWIERWRQFGSDVAASSGFTPGDQT